MKRQTLFRRLTALLSVRQATPAFKSLPFQKRRLSFEPLETRELLDVAPAFAVVDLSTSAELENQDVLSLTSYSTDAAGSEVLPAYGEVVYRRLALKNLGDSSLDVTSVSVSNSSRVELVGNLPDSLRPYEETTFLLKWRALQSESPTLTIETNSLTQPTQTINLSCVVRPNSTVLPQLATLTLVNDTGENDSDLSTCNPAVLGSTFGELYGGYVDVEFDLDGDNQVDAIERVDVSGAFDFDPSVYSTSFEPPESGTHAVSLRYRAAIYNAYDELVERETWRTFNYVLEPAPTSSLVVSNLAFDRNFDGDWTQPNVAAITGSVSGTGSRAIQLQIGANRYQFETTESAFSVPVPQGLTYGTVNTLSVRAGQYDATTQRVLYGEWSAISVTPTPPSVATLELQNDDGESANDGVSGDITLVGTLANVVGRNFAEVEFFCNGTSIGSATTDDDGAFTFEPSKLPINAGVASGTISARAVWRPSNGSPVYGTERSIAVTYLSPLASDNYALNVELTDALDNQSSLPTTSTPAFAASCEFDVDLDVEFEYRWKIANSQTWSETACVFANAEESEEEVDSLLFNATFYIPGLYNLTTSSTNVDLQIRPRIYDVVLCDYVSTDAWTAYSFVFQKPSATAPTISSVALAAPSDGIGSVTSNPTISGRIASGDSISGVRINVYSDAARIGETTTDAYGRFSFRPQNLAYGSQTISCAAEIWDATSRQYVEGTSASLTFAYVAPCVFAPTLGDLRLWDDTGTPNDGVTANPTLYGKIAVPANGDETINAYLAVEYDLDEDGISDGFVRANSSGEFFIEPVLTVGAHTINVRAARWDSNANAEVVGVWTPIVLTVVAPSSSLPGVLSFAPTDSQEPVPGQIVSYSSSVSGRVTSEAGYDDLVVQYEILSGGIAGSTTFESHVDARGRFCWSPELAYSTSDSNVSVRVRVGKVNSASSTTWGAWSTTTFIYRATLETTITTASASSSDRSDAEDFELKLNGVVSPGVGIRTTWIEYDVDGDGKADGRVSPNSSAQFTFYAVPKTTTLALRAVDRLLDDAERISSQGWIQVSTPNFATDAIATELNLYFIDDLDYIPYLQVENYQGAYANLVVALDYDRDGLADATLSPNAQGRLSVSDVVGALSSNDVAIRSGFSVVFAHIASPEADVTEEIPFPLYTGDVSDELQEYDDFCQVFASLVDYDPSDVPGSAVNTVNKLVYQTTPEEEIDLVNEEDASIIFGAQIDVDALRNIPIPNVEIPNLNGEFVDLSRDVALQATLAAIENSYNAGILVAQNLWRETCDALVSQYNSVVDSAWREYSTSVSRKKQEFETVEATTWEDSDAYAKIDEQWQNETSRLAEIRSQSIASLNAWLQTECHNLRTTYDSTVLTSHDSACNYNGHSHACQTQQINAREAYYKAKIQLSLEYTSKQLIVDCDYDKALLASRARRDVALAEGKRAYETQKETRLATLAREISTSGLAYQTAVANALNAYYAGEIVNGEFTGGLADATATYRKTLGGLAQTATQQTWSAIRSAVDAWKINSGTDSTWGGYVDSLYSLSETQALANSAANATAVNAEADAQKAADVASANAYCAYLISDATVLCASEQASATNSQTLQIATLDISAQNTRAESDANVEYMTAQLDQILAIRLETIRHMRDDGVTTACKLGARDRALVGETNFSTRWALENATQNELSALWKENAIERLKSEVEIYEAVVSTAADFETSLLTAQRNSDAASWQALGNFWKSEIARVASQSIGSESALNAFHTSINTADFTELAAYASLESNYDQAISTASFNARQGEFTLIKNLWTSEYASYFTELDDACQNLSDSFVGGFYRSLVSAAQTDYAFQWANETNYFNQILAKDSAYVNTARNLNNDYANDVSDAIHAYAQSQVVVTDSSVNRGKLCEQDEVDARVAYYIARDEADAELSQKTINAKKDALNQKLDLLDIWATYVVDQNWTYDTVRYGGYDSITYLLIEPNNMNNIESALFIGGVKTTIPTATNLDEVSIDGFSGTTPTALANIPLYTDALLWRGYNAGTLWTAFNNLTASVKSMTIKNGELTADSTKAAARKQYVTTRLQLFGTEAEAHLDDATNDFISELNAEKTLNSTLWDASVTTQNGVMSAIVATDDTANAASYINSSLGSALNKTKSAASAFGDFQIAIRGRQYNGAGATNPRLNLYGLDATWATNAKSLRNQYFNATANAVADYAFDLTSACSDYISATLVALTSSESSYNNALKTYSVDAMNAESDYASALFNADKTRELAYLDAAIAELTANYTKEAELAGTRANAYDGKYQSAKTYLAGTQFQQKLYMYDVRNASADDRTAYFDEVTSSANQVATIQNNANNDDSTIATQNAATLEATETANAAARATAEQAAEQTFKLTSERAWRDGYMDRLELGATLKNAFEGISANYQSALNTATSDYRDSAFAAWDDFDDSMSEIAKTLGYQESRLDLGLAIPSNAFENPAYDFEICFAVGTQVLMADGSTKSIEEIVPGDFVLAAQHDLPESVPVKARVARTFDNGLKQVVRLKFENNEELVCTPEHPFYVVGRGWTSANALRAGDSCLSSNGKRVVFTERENLAQECRVFNIEVEEKHTYFVGVDSGILVHNHCVGHHFLPYSVLRDVYLQNPTLFTEEALEVASGFYSGDLEGGHRYDKAHAKYNKKVRTLFDNFIDDFKKNNVGKQITKADMERFIIEYVIPGKSMTGRNINAIKNFNKDVISRIKDSNVKATILDIFNKSINKETVLYKNLIDDTKTKGHSLLNGKDRRYGLELGEAFRNRAILGSLHFFDAVNVIQDVRDADAASQMICFSALNEAKRIANDNSLPLNEKRAQFHAYVWSLTHQYTSSNSFVNIVMYGRLLQVFRRN